MEKKVSWTGMSILIGTMIGAGILGIPYVISKSGFLLGSIEIILLGGVMLLLNLLLSAIIINVDGRHQLTGYMEKFLGRTGKSFMAIAMVLGIYSAMIAYIIGEGAAISSILGGSPEIYSLIFFILASLIIFFGIKTTGKAEIISVSMIIIITILLGIFSYDKITPSNYTAPFNWGLIFVPYGVILFSYFGTAAIPEVKEYLSRKKNTFIRSVAIGSIIPIIIYLLFTAVIVGLVGFDKFSALSPNDRIATIALSITVNRLFGGFANIFAVLTMLTSYIALGLALKEMYEYDYNMNRYLSFILAVGIPLIIAVSGITHFIQIISLAGIFTVGLTGILIALAYLSMVKDKKNKAQQRYNLRYGKAVSIFLIILFLLGIVNQLFPVF